MLPAVLHGLDLESEHCMFENQSGTVTMVPFSGAQCSVNGVVVSEPSKLNQGEQLISASASALPDLLEFDSAASLASRRRHFTGQDQHVSLQPSEGSSQTAGETEGEHAPPPPAGQAEDCRPDGVRVLLRAVSCPPSACP